MLLKLIEMVTSKGFKVVGANTDAIEVLVPKTRLDEYLVICNEWENWSSMTLDHEYFSKIYRLSCNHYLAIKADKEGKPIVDNEGNIKYKAKGWFEPESDLLKGYEYPIVKMAVIKRLIDNVPITQTIRNHTDILDFCLSQKMGKGFDAYLGPNLLSKTNRFYACKSSPYYMLKYSHETRSYEHMLKGIRASVVNDVRIRKPINEYDINYHFYEQAASKIVDKVLKPVYQTSLF